MYRIQKWAIAVACGVTAIFSSLSPVAAEEACAKDALGVSRTIEVDTTGGPWFGEPYGNRDFLAPGEVVLTFDDGPSPRDTPAILAALAAECTKATFFVVGQMVVRYPELVARAVAQGHTIGTHTWSHPNLARISKERAIQQIEATFNAAQSASPEPIAPFFRYPYLSSSKATEAYMRSRNIGQFAIDIDSFDWRNRNAKTVVARVMAGLKRRGRGIVLLHDIHKSTAASVPELLAQLKAQGFKIVHLKAKSKVDLIADVEPPTRKATASKSSRKNKNQKSAQRKRSTSPSFGFGTTW